MLYMVANERSLGGVRLAAATVVSYGGPERTGARHIERGRLHRWSLAVANNGDTFDLGSILGEKGIVEIALSGTRSTPPGNAGTAITPPSGAISFTYSTTTRIVTFVVGGAVLADLLVWTSE